jgi:hypothetical protein
MKTEAVFGSAMKKTLYFASFVLFAALSAGCTDIQEPTGPANKGDKITLTVSAVTKNPKISDEAGTRISYGSTDATWETGDKIFLVKSDGTTITLTIADGIGTSTGSFTSTDPVVAGTYIPYAVSASSLSNGFVSIATGVITLDLSIPGGGTLADALEHDILKGGSLVLTDNQSNASITGLTTHILSYLRFRFNASAKAVTSVGMSSTGGINQTVTIAANGTVSGSNPSTGTFSVTASDDGAGCYAGYFAVYDKTTATLLAHAEDEDGGKYTRLLSTKAEADYTAGTVYGKTITLSDAMMTAGATGTLSSQSWKNLGLSVKWAEFNVGSSSEYSYDRNYDSRVSGAGGRDTYGVPANSCTVIPAEWEGWRIPSWEEVAELFYASEREWITGEHNGVKFNCNDNYVAMGAGGYQERRHNTDTWTLYEEGSAVYFYWGGTWTYTSFTGGVVQRWARVQNSGTSLGSYAKGLESRDYWYYYQAAMRLVCDY